METVVGVVVIIAGLVAMQPYLQRAMQGNLFATSQSFGLQFDPRDTWDERPSININETITHQSAVGMIEATLIPALPPSKLQQGVISILKNEDYATWYFSSLPTGPVPREPAGERSKVTSDWTTGGSLTARDAR